MTLRIVGAGLCRTGTMSQKVALERLLGAPCHHMTELFEHPEQVPHWQVLADGGTPDWDTLLHGYVAAVDLPASFAWRELAERHPDAPVLLSTRLWISARCASRSRRPPSRRSSRSPMTSASAPGAASRSSSTGAGPR